MEMIPSPGVCLIITRKSRGNFQFLAVKRVLTRRPVREDGFGLRFGSELEKRRSRVESEGGAGAGRVQLCVAASRFLSGFAIPAMRVIPGQLERSAISGKKALRRYFVTSSVSGGRMLEREAIQSRAGEFCTPQEAKPCLWGGEQCHPSDLRTCGLTGLPVNVRFLSDFAGRPSLDALLGLLSGVRRDADESMRWDEINEKGAKAVCGRWRIESAQLSPDGRHLAACAEVKGSRNGDLLL
jgi:hypothetical protein